jgi:hypothetical protein
VDALEVVTSADGTLIARFISSALRLEDEMVALQADAIAADGHCTFPSISLHDGVFSGSFGCHAGPRREKVVQQQFDTLTTSRLAPERNVRHAERSANHFVEVDGHPDAHP